MKNLFYLLSIFFVFCSCSSEKKTFNVDEKPSNVFYEDLPLGCDSAKIVDYNNILSSYVGRLENEEEDTPIVMVFYFGEDQVLVKSNDFQTKSIKIYNREEYSKEFCITKRMIENNINIEYSVNNDLLGVADKNGIITTTRGWSSWLDCIDEVTDDTADGKYGKTGKLLNKICSSCAVAAAAAYCLF